MKIKLPEFDLSKFTKVYAGEKSRYATATAVAFKNEDRLISAQFLSKTLYLHNSNDNYKIINSLVSDYYIDLIDCRKDRLIASNYPSYEVKNGFVSLFKIGNDDIELIRHYDLYKHKCHGCRFVDDNKVIITNTANNKSLIFLDLVSGKTEEFKEFDYYPKDIYIVGEYLYMVSSESRPDKIKTKILDSKLYKFNLKSLDKIFELKFYGQTDSMTINDNNIYITLQGQNSLAHIIEQDIGFVYHREIKGFNFPHGIASIGDKIAVSNYGDNSVDILTADDLNIVSI